MLDYISGYVYISRVLYVYIYIYTKANIWVFIYIYNISFILFLYQSSFLSLLNYCHSLLTFLPPFTLVHLHTSIQQLG